MAKRTGKEQVDVTPEMQKRIENLFYRTWGVIAYDALQLGRMSKVERAEMCLDYLDWYGGDKEAYEVFEKNIHTSIDTKLFKKTIKTVAKSL